MQMRAVVKPMCRLLCQEELPLQGSSWFEGLGPTAVGAPGMGAWARHRTWEPATLCRHF